MKENLERQRFKLTKKPVTMRRDFNAEKKLFATAHRPYGLRVKEKGREG